MAQVQKKKEYFDDQFRLYVKEHLLPALNLKGSTFSIEPTDKGCHSLILLLQVNDFKPLIISGVRKKYKLNRAVRNSSYLSRLGFNVPRILYADGSGKTYRRLGRYFMVEERVEGSSLYELSDPTDFMPLVADLFAELHKINSDRWGKIGSQRKRAFYRYINRRIQGQLKQLTELDDNFFSPEEIKGYTNWCKRQKNTINSCRYFSLCHGDPYLTNILIDKDNQLYLLDNDNTKYFPMAIEFYKVGLALNQDDPQKMATWQSLYLSSLPEKLREEFLSTHNFYLAYVLLRIIVDFLNDNWHRDIPYAFSLDYVKNLFRKCIED